MLLRKESKSPRNAGRVRPALEALEDRNLMAMGIWFNTWTNDVIIEGNDRGNYATVSLELRNRLNSYDDQLRVAVVERTPGTTTWPGYVQYFNLYRFDGRQMAPNIARVVFYARDGWDEFVNNTYTRSYVDGGAGGDRIIGGHSSDTLYGGAGEDTIEGRGGNDWINGGDGRSYTDGTDLLYGGPDNDTLYGWSGDDRLYGETGTDWLYGNAGRDYLVGGYANGNGDWELDYLCGGDDIGTDDYTPDVLISACHWIYVGGRFGWLAWQEDNLLVGVGDSIEYQWS